MMNYESEYKVLQPNNDLTKRKGYWDLAKGLQKTDGLDTSEYLETVIAATLSGEYGISDAKAALERHYAGVTYNCPNADEMEADIVASRIVEMLEVDDFKFSPIMLKSIHKKLFHDVLPYKWVGQWRTENIIKDQEILNGRTVNYANFDEIEDFLTHDFALEKNAHYSFPFDSEQIDRLINFTSAVWQTHPFREGNTRTVSTFLIKYLKSMGVEVTNEPFIEHSAWFRDALVRHNYANVPMGVHPEAKYITMFFENILLDADHDLASFNLECRTLFEPRNQDKCN